MLVCGSLSLFCPVLFPARLPPCSTADFPITVRDQVGFTIGCLAASLTCGVKGSGYDFSAYTFPMYTEYKAGESLLTQCYRPTDVSCAAGVTITTGPVINGIDTKGPYSKLIRSADGSATVGCLKSTATVCPAAAPFSYITMGAGGETLEECRNTGAACNTTATVFNIRATNSGVLSGCVTATSTCELLLPARVWPCMHCLCASLLVQTLALCAGNWQQQP
jgi:hypothetical protein